MTLDQINAYQDEMLTLKEVAAFFRISIVTAQRWCRSGRLPAVKYGKEYRIRRSALEENITKKLNKASE